MSANLPGKKPSTAGGERASRPNLANPWRELLLFLLVNVGGFAVDIGLLRWISSGNDHNLREPAIAILLFLPFVLLEWPVYRRARTWLGRALALYLGMLGFLVALPAFAWVTDYDKLAGGSASVTKMFAFVLSYGHLLGLPMLAVMIGLHVVVYWLLRRLGLSEIGRPIDFSSF